MKKFWFVIAGLMMGTSPRSFAAVVKMEAPPKVEESSPEADKAAVHAASSEADQWAATKKPVPPSPAAAPAAPSAPAAAAAVPTPAPVPSAAPEAPPVAAASHPTYVPKPGLNEMKGKLASKGYDPRTLRVSVDGGYSVEFTYDKQTILVNGGSPVTMDELEYGDELIVRYAGKELNALEIDRVRKAPRPQ